MSDAHDQEFNESTDNEQLAHTIRVLKAIRNVNQLITRAQDRDSLLQGACDCLTDARGYGNAWIALLDEEQQLRAAYESGLGEAFRPMLEHLHADRLTACCRRALAEAAVVMVEDPSTHCTDCPLAKTYEGRMAMVVRLAYGERIFGVLAVSIPATLMQDEEEEALLAELAADLAFALEKLDLAAEWKQAQDQLHEERQRLGFVIDGSRLGTWEWNVQTNETVFNETWAAMLGYTLEELTPYSYETWVGLMHPEDLHLAKEQLARCVEGKIKDYTCEFRMRHKEGHWVWVLDRGQVMTHDAAGKPLLMYGTHDDISERKQHEEALRKAQELANAIIEHGPVATTLANRDGIIVMANQRAETVLGLHRSMIDGLAYNAPTWRISHADGSPFPDEHLPFAQVMAHDKPVYNVEHAITEPDGSRRILSINGAPLHDAQGAIDQVIFAIQDITEQRQIEEALRRSEEHHRITLESIGDAVIATDAEGRVTTMNAVAEELTAWPRAEAAGRPLAEIFHIIKAGTRERVENPVAKVLASGRIVGLANHTALIARDGTERQIADSAAPIRPDDDAMIQGVVLVFRDVTEEYRQQEALRESEERFQKMLSLVPDMISIHDPDMNILYSNWKGFAAVPQEQRILGSKCHRAYRGLDTICPDCQACQVIASKEPFQQEVELPEGMWIDLRVIPLLGADGEVKMFVEWVSDISARKQAEQEHEDLQAQLIQSQKMDAIGQLAGGVAHDFNNQLTGVMGFASMLLERLDDPTLKRYAEGIITAARRSADLTQQLLAFSRKGQFQRIPVDVHRIINDTVEMLQHSIDKRIRIRRRLEAQQAQIIGDPSQLQNALLNLAVNARDAMSEGGELTFSTSIATLEARSLPGFELSPGSYLIVAVEDSGSGMSQEVQAHLFEPFFTTKEQGKGTGMGLASAFGTVKQHQGAITVYSEPGHGSTFRLYLPLAEQGNEASHGETPPMGVRSQLRILLVDDEELVREFVQDMLVEVGHTVETATDGRRALERYRQIWQEIDLVILDMIMPGLDGRDTFRAMKAINPAVRAILASGYSLNQQSQAILAEGALGFVQKPFSPNQLLRAVECATMEQGGPADGLHE